MDIKETKRKNLLIRLMERLKLGANFSKEQKTGNIKLKKKIVLIAMTGILGANALFTGCDSDDIILTDKDGNLLVSLQEGEMNLLSEVLEKIEYQQAVSEYIEGNDTLLKAYSHPLTFLESKGYDVEAIKRGELKFETFSYVKESEPNTLYVRTSTFNEDDEKSSYFSYYSQYLLSYDLTENEMKTYKYLYENNYIQANAAIGLISELREPVILVDVNINQIHDELYTKEFKNIGNNFKWSDGVDLVQFGNCSIDDQTLEIHLFSKNGGHIGVYTMTNFVLLREEELKGVNILLTGGFQFSEKDAQTLINSTERATYYIPDLGVNNVKDLGN